MRAVWFDVTLAWAVREMAPGSVPICNCSDPVVEVGLQFRFAAVRVVDAPNVAGDEIAATVLNTGALLFVTEMDPETGRSIDATVTRPLAASES